MRASREGRKRQDEKVCLIARPQVCTIGPVVLVRASQQGHITKCGRCERVKNLVPRDVNQEPLQRVSVGLEGNNSTAVWSTCLDEPQSLDDAGLPS